MNRPGSAAMVLLGLGALGINVFVGILAWALAFKSGAVGAAAQEIDRAICAGRTHAQTERDADRA